MCVDVFNRENGPDAGSIDPAALEIIIDEKCGAPDEDAFWKRIIPGIDIASLSDRIISALYERKIAVVEMAHSDLPDRWLAPYAVYDDAPIYQFLTRYFSGTLSPDIQVAEFACRYVLSRQDIFENMFDTFPHSKKMELFIHLGVSSGLEAITKLSQEMDEICKIEMATDPEHISAKYAAHQDSYRWLLAIAENPFTPKSVLLSLENIKQVKFASRIRMASHKTLQKNKLQHRGE